MLFKDLHIIEIEKYITRYISRGGTIIFLFRKIILTRVQFRFFMGMSQSTIKTLWFIVSLALARREI